MQDEKIAILEFFKTNASYAFQKSFQNTEWTGYCSTLWYKFVMNNPLLIKKIISIFLTHDFWKRNLF